MDGPRRLLYSRSADRAVTAHGSPGRALMLEAHHLVKRFFGITVVPPLWFVGLHETFAGSVIDQLPRGVPPRRFATAEHDATQVYRSLWPLFHGLAIVAVLAFILVL